ncbi:unnamed protein product, partial [Hydatigera taeniaeformis]|uniref:EF-hand domain-containing protein n=1 Tax=Hydatigena taeniaeformis TaxID=6205 RepID=A0A0R3WRR5_HYDTA
MDKILNFLKALDSTKSHFLDPFDELLKALYETRHSGWRKSFKALPPSLFSCEEAHAACNAAIGVTCGEADGVRLLLGLVYVFALNVLFITHLYFALFNLAFFQALRIRMLSA